MLCIFRYTLTYHDAPGWRFLSTRGLAFQGTKSGRFAGSADVGFQNPPASYIMKRTLILSGHLTDIFLLVAFSSYFYNLKNKISRM